MMRPLPIAASLALLLAAFAVTAQDPSAPAAADAPAPATEAAPVAAAPAPAAPAAPAAGDATRGKGLTGYKNAYPSYHVPKIGGQSETYLRNALTEYGTGKRKHPTMQAQAESFSQQDIADIAAYLSSLK